MRILLVNDHAEFGGAENYVQNLKKQLEKEHEVALLTLDGSEKADYTIEEGSNPFFKLRNRYFSNFRLRRKLKKKIKDFDPDIVHLNKNIVAPISVLKALEGEKVVKTVHDFGYISLEDKYAYDMNKWERKFRKKLDRGTHTYLKKFRPKIIGQYTAPSQALTSSLKGAGYNPVEHLPNFVEEKDHNFGGEHYIFVGRLEDGKAPDLLVESYIRAEKEAESGDIPPLEIAGKGKMKEELERKVEENTLEEKITVHGYVSNEKLEKLYKNSIAVVIPSRWRENNPLVALEAKAYGKPLVVSDRGGLPELVENGETGYIFGYEDAEELLEALKKEAELSNMGERSLNDYKENYTPEAHTEKLLNIYREVEEE